MMEVNKELLEACKEALKCIARLTPFPYDNNSPVLTDAINKTADYADKVRAILRKAIENAETQ